MIRRTRRSRSSRRPSPAKATPASRRSRPPSPAVPRTARASTAQLTSDADLAKETENSLRLSRPSRRAAGTSPCQRAGFSTAVNVVVSGPDQATVSKATQQVLDAIKDQPDIVNLKSDLVAGTPSVEVVVDPNKAIAAGLTTAGVAYIHGVLTERGRVQTADGTEYDVYMGIDPAAVNSVDALKALPMGTVGTKRCRSRRCRM